MRESIKIFWLVFFPVLLLALILWCYLGRNSHFPVLAGMIENSLMKQNNLQGRIVQQQKFLQESEPPLRQLEGLRQDAFEEDKEIISEFRGRIEQLYLWSENQDNRQSQAVKRF
mgnify:CR=1 FL=1